MRRAAVHVCLGVAYSALSALCHATGSARINYVGRAVHNSVAGVCVAIFVTSHLNLEEASSSLCSFVLRLCI